MQKGFQAGLPALFPHAEGYQRAGGGGFIQRHYIGRIGLGGSCGDDFHYFSAKLARPLQDAFEHRRRRSVRKVVVRADEHRAVLPAGLPDAAADGCRRLHFQVHILGTGLYSPLQQLRRLGFFTQTTGGYERHIGGREQQIYILVLQGAAVQPDFGHLHGTAVQDIQDFLQFLMLYAGANHSVSVISFKTLLHFDGRVFT